MFDEIAIESNVTTNAFADSEDDEDDQPLTMFASKPSLSCETGDSISEVFTTETPTTPMTLIDLTENDDVLVVDNISNQKTEREKLVLRLVSMGFELRNVPGDGNCCFHSIVDQIYGFVDSDKAKSLREESCKYMRQHAEHFTEFLERDGQQMTTSSLAQRGRFKFLAMLSTTFLFFSSHA